MCVYMYVARTQWFLKTSSLKAMLLTLSATLLLGSLCEYACVHTYICVNVNLCLFQWMHACICLRSWPYVGFCCSVPFVQMCAYTFLSIYRIICVYICIHDELHEFHWRNLRKLCYHIISENLAIDDLVARCIYIKGFFCTPACSNMFLRLIEFVIHTYAHMCHIHMYIKGSFCTPACSNMSFEIHWVRDTYICTCVSQTYVYVTYACLSTNRTRDLVFRIFLWGGYD